MLKSAKKERKFTP